MITGKNIISHYLNYLTKNAILEANLYYLFSMDSLYNIKADLKLKTKERSEPR